MLVLGRKRGETIRIFQPGVDPVDVTVTKVRGDRVSVGVQAPDTVRVVRVELIDLLGKADTPEEPAKVAG